MKIMKKKIQFTPDVNNMFRLLNEKNIHTVCQEAKCPNLAECFEKKTATFLLMGDTCTRNCGFCGVKKSKNPLPLDPQEPEKIAAAVHELKLQYCVLTSVTRDDLHDEGISHYIQTIEAIKKINPETKIEILTPDFRQNMNNIEPLIHTPIHVFNHNLETVPRLYPEIRSMADYQHSLSLLKKVKSIRPSLLLKSGIMVGLGETESELMILIDDLVQNKCDIFTVGQYFPPSKKHYKLKELKQTDFFKKIEITAKSKGIPYVFSGTYIRSSYYAEEVFLSSRLDSSPNSIDC